MQRDSRLESLCCKKGERQWWVHRTYQNAHEILVLLKAPDEDAAMAIVRAEWPGGIWNFCGEKPADWLPAGLELALWMQERLGKDKAA